MISHRSRLLALGAVFVMAGCGEQAGPTAPVSGAQPLLKPVVAALQADCATIQDGTITDSAGNPVTVGNDQYGYNYQSHMFNGTYDGSDRNLDGTYWGSTGDYVNDKLMMKWSDDWTANKDCNGDGKLDRGANANGISQGWLTNHIEGDYDSDGNGTQDAHYTYFVKIVWVGLGGSLWGQYEIIQEVSNDPVGGLHGVQFKPVRPGLGLNDHWTE